MEEWELGIEDRQRFAIKDTSIMDSWITTYTGKRFHILNPQPEEVDIVDIAHALAGIVRYNGHTVKRLTVAQHSYAVSMVVPPEYALVGLLHDAAEAYIGDMVGPLKNSGLVGLFKQIEMRILEGAIYPALGVPLELVAEAAIEIKRADRRMLATERRDVHHCKEVWECIDGVEPYRETMFANVWNDVVAEALFLTRFAALDMREED